MLNAILNFATCATNGTQDTQRICVFTVIQSMNENKYALLSDEKLSGIPQRNQIEQLQIR